MDNGSWGDPDDDSPTCLQLTEWGLKMAKWCEVEYPDAADSVAYRKARAAGWPGWPGEATDG